MLIAITTKSDLLALGRLIEEEDLTPVIDRTYPLSETPDAVAYVEEGHARGKVALTVSGTPASPARETDLP